VQKSNPGVIDFALQGRVCFVRAIPPSMCPDCKSEQGFQSKGWQTRVLLDPQAQMELAFKTWTCLQCELSTA